MLPNGHRRSALLAAVLWASSLHRLVRPQGLEAPRAKLRIAGVQPFTGSWPAGRSMALGGQKMVEYVNANPELLPDYELEVIWQDGGCDAGVGIRVIYSNFFQDTYFPADGAAISGVKAVAILGPGCSGTAIQNAVFAHYLRMPAMSNSAVRPSLSDRATFPSFWRGLTPDTAFNRAWLALARSFELERFTVVTGSRGDSWEAMTGPLMDVAEELGMRSVGGPMPAIYQRGDEELRGWELQTASLDTAETIIDELMALRPSPPRFAVILGFADVVRTLLCAAYRKGLSGITFFAFGWFGSYFYRSGLDDLPCTAPQMEAAINGTITATQSMRNPNPGRRLTCASGATVGDFFAYQDEAAEDDPRAEAASTADTVCTLALMLHELIYTHNLTASDLERLSESDFRTANDIIGATDFEGTQGRFSFVPGTPDPNQAVLLEQYQNGEYNRTRERVVLARYKDNSFSWSGAPVWLPGGRTAVPLEGGNGSGNGSSAIEFEYGAGGKLESFIVCPNGTLLDLAGNVCQSCPPNTEYAPSVGQCLCVAGTVQTDGGCAPCPGGSFSSKIGSLMCEACEAGKYAPGGSTSCTFCERGRYANRTQSAECTRCDAGRTTRDIAATLPSACVCTAGYFDRDGACARCPTRSTTEGINATSSAGCLCEGGTYMTADFTACAPCPKGMICPEGNAPPKLRAGFWADAADSERRDYSVYRCRSVLECLEGDVGSNCARFREGTACARCEVGATPKENGECGECEGQQIAFLFLGLALVGLVLLALYAYSRLDVVKTSQNSLSIGVCVGQIPLALQVMSVIGVMQVSWIEPASTFLRILSVVNFRIEVFSFSCMVPESSAVLLFLSKLMVFPGLATVLLGIFLAERYRTGFINLNSVFNSVGVLYLVVYMTLAVLALSPFLCLDNPNGTMSMSTNPSVLCDGEYPYVALAALGALAFLCYCVLFFAFVIYLVWQHPAMISSGRGHLILSRYRFVFQRYKTQCYYYAPMFLARGLAIALLPIVFASHGHRQLACLSCLLLATMGVQAWLLPWNGRAPNLTDACALGCSMLFLTCAALIQRPDEDAMDRIMDDMQVLFTLLIVFFFAVFVATLAFLLYRRFFPARQYMSFLCHHKAGCAAGARLMKMEMLRHGVPTVFLDSDELDDLENVLDIVRHVRTLVVLLTAETLWRPWCAGEITMGHKCRISTVGVAYDGYTEPTDADLVPETMSAKWASEAFKYVAQQGVTLEAVCQAYVALRERPKAHLERRNVDSDGVGSLVDAAKAVIEEVRPQRGMRIRINSATSDTRTATVADVVVLANNLDGEAVSTAQILSQMMQSETHRYVRVVCEPSDILGMVAAPPRQRHVQDMRSWASEDSAATSRSAASVAPPSTPRVFLVSLTTGCITSKPFAAAVMKAGRCWPDVEIVTIRSPEFVFPTRDAFENTVCPAVAAITSAPAEEVMQYYGPLLSNLALAFGPAGNWSVMGTEVRMIIKRVQAKKKSSALSMQSASVPKLDKRLSAMRMSEGPMGPMEPEGPEGPVVDVDTYKTKESL